MAKLQLEELTHKNIYDFMKDIEIQLSTSLNTQVEYFYEEPIIIERDNDIFYSISFILRKNNYIMFRINFYRNTFDVSSIDFYTDHNLLPTTYVDLDNISFDELIKIITEIIGKNKKEIKHESTVKINLSGITDTSFIEYIEGLIQDDIDIDGTLSEDLAEEVYKDYLDFSKDKTIISKELFFKNLKNIGINLVKNIVVQKYNFKEKEIVTIEDDIKAQKFNYLGLEAFTSTKKFKLMVNTARDIVEGRSYSFIIAGDPGIGKTYEIKDLLLEKEFGMSVNNVSSGENTYVYLKGSISSAELYNTLFEHRKGLIVFDDCDTPLKNTESLNILKACTDNKQIRTVSWSNTATRKNFEDLKKILHGDGYDIEELIKNNEWDKIVEYSIDYDTGALPFFNYEGRIIIITNLYKKDLDTALFSRSDFIEISLTKEEILERIENVVRSGGFKVLDSTVKDQLETLKIMNDFNILWEKTDFRKFDKCVRWYMKRNIDKDYKLAIANILYEDTSHGGK